MRTMLHEMGGQNRPKKHPKTG